MRTFLRFSSSAAVTFYVCVAAGQAAPSDQSSTPRQPAAAAEGPAIAEPSSRGIAVTGDLLARRAAATSFSVKAQRDAIVAAAAWASFLPRLTASARYTRLSSLTNPSLGGGSSTGSQLVSPDAPGTENPRVVAIAPNNFTFPVLLDNFVLQAQLAVPISDYFLRINRGYTAASHAVEAARFDAQAAQAKAATEGKIALYTFIRANGALQVAQQTLADVKAHAQDVKNQELARNASRVDVLRAETAVSAAGLQVERMKNLVVLTEKQVRMAAHLGDNDAFYLSESVDAPLPKVVGTTAELVREAQQNRPEIRGIAANIEALRAQGKIARASSLPQVLGLGEVTYANPNQRKFPNTPDFFATWSLSLQATWSPNDIPSSNAAGSQVDARIQSIEAGRQALREGIELEVTQAQMQMRESEQAIPSAMQQLESSTEALRVARELFRAGRATATNVIDAETELTRARLELVNANVESRISRAKLEHATGRDLRFVTAL
jgi:outer membrane protein